MKQILTAFRSLDRKRQLGLGCGALVLACLVCTTLTAIISPPRPTPRTIQALPTASQATATLEPTNTAQPQSTATAAPSPTREPSPLPTNTNAPAATATSASTSNSCPQGCLTHVAGCDIIGNVSARNNNQKIYHLPSSLDYDEIKFDAAQGDRYFCTEAEAQANDFRPPNR